MACTLAVVLLAAGCGRASTPTPTQSAPQTTTPPPDAAAPVRPGPTPIPATEFGLPDEAETFPPDLAVLTHDNLDRLAPFRRLTAEGLPASLTVASLEYPADYEFQLAGLLDDGQLVVWNMATSAVVYRDQYAPAASLPGRNPALAISTSFQGHLASAATMQGFGGAQAVVVRSPHQMHEPLVLSAASQTIDPDQITGLAFSADGRWLAAGMADGERGQLMVWDVWQSEAVQRLVEVQFDRPVAALAFSSDGSLLQVAVGAELIQLDPNDGRELERRQFEFQIQGFSRGGPLSVWGARQAYFEVVDPQTLSAAEEFRRVEVSPDGRLAVLVDGGRLRVWDLDAGAERLSLRSAAGLLDARFFANGRLLATVDSQANVLLWGVPAGEQLPAERAVITPSNAVRLERVATLFLPGGPEVRVTSDSRELTVGSLHGIYLVDLPGLEMGRMLLRRGGSSAFSVSADDRWIAQVAADDRVQIWSRQGERPELELGFPDEFCCSDLFFTPDGDTLITHVGFGARIWDLQSGQERFERPGAQAVHVSPEGSRLAFQEGLEVNIIDLQTQRVLRTLTGFETASPVVGTAFSPTWGVMYWAGRAHLQFIDVDRGALGAEIPFSWGRFSPAGDRLAAVEAGWTMASVGEVHQFDVQTGETLTVFDHGEDAIVDAVAYSPDGNLLVSATEFSVRVWDANTGQQLVALPQAPEDVYQLAFAPDQRALITVSAGDRIDFWVVRQAAASASPTISAAIAGSAVQFDGLELRAVGDGSALLWRVTP